LTALFKLDRYQAFLFDCDGTIADSMDQHLEAWNFALAQQGGQITATENQFYAGPAWQTRARLLFAGRTEAGDKC
jgi:beta-phosphoglucomutase-like phosphatase (HAD superfamily)